MAALTKRRRTKITRKEFRIMENHSTEIHLQRVNPRAGFGS
jgi:hypothetical protein